ncbi:MAG: Uma2 family endonuclease [Cyanobacteriota bacterium]|nr:Uma2 family endonuclease [Cyanobacteriota bacterium]
MISLVKWSIKDYHQMVAAGITADRHLELIDGDIIEMSPEGPLHASRIRKGANYLRHILANLALVSEAHPITLSTSEPEPDIAIIKLPESKYERLHPQPEDIFWLIEVADATLSKDLNEKKRIYAGAGINEYWVMNLKANLLTVFRQPINNDYSLKMELNAGEVVPLAFPQIKISVSRMLS